MTRHPTGIVANVAVIVALLDTRLIHSGLTETDWFVIVGAIAGIVSYKTPR